MIRSMTGFGRFQQTLGDYDILVEVRSVNHRFFEFSCKTPRAYAYLEDKLKTFFGDRIARGKVTVNVYIQRIGGLSEEIEINRDIAGQYIQALRNIKDEFGLADDLSLCAVAKLPDVFTVVKTKEDEKLVIDSVFQVAQVAIDDFVTMREREGERLKADLLLRAQNILSNVQIVEEATPKTVNAYRTKLEEKIRELLADTQIDEGRLLTEVAIFADKVAVDEETVRLKSHIASLQEILQSDEAVGRKLDFLVQEFNREANTIGSKCTDSDIAKVVVELKSEIEKIREQIQNIE